MSQTQRIGWGGVYGLAVLVACGGGGGGGGGGGDADVAGDTSGGSGDIGTDGDAGSDPTGDAGDTRNDAGSGDTIDEEVVEEIGDPCTSQRDCQGWGVCQTDGFCHRGPRCGALSNWAGCVDYLNELEPGLGRQAGCVETRCVAYCAEDADCYDGELCTDWGTCRPFTGEITGIEPGGGARAPLRVGIAEELMHFPIGLSLAGYGERAAFDDGRYVKSLRATAGEMEGLYTRAVAFDNGERQLLFLSSPTIFPSMSLHEELCRILQDETGYDWRDSLILSSSHTHSGPARFWEVPLDAATPIGIFGTDEFSQQSFDWMLETFVAAARAALANLEPARMGWTIVESYDTEDEVGRDRWGETPPFDDNRLLLIRIDDAEGNPRASLISFGAHGTDNSSDYATGDALGGVEHGMEEALGEAFDRYVPVIFFSQNSGNMSPAGTTQGHRWPQSYERIGEAFVVRAFNAFGDIDTTDDVSLGAHTYRFPITYDRLGYADGEWRGPGGYPLGGEYHNGAISCASTRNWGDDDYATHGRPDDLTCVALHFLLQNRNPTLFNRAQITAIDLAGLPILTMPGELTMELSWQVLNALHDRFGIDPLQAWTLGYAQTHLLYLVPTNMRGEAPPYPGLSAPQSPEEYPDWAFSFLQGGYESSMSPWGHRLGDYLVERAMDAWALFEDPTHDPETPPTLPVTFTRVDEEPFPVDLTDAELVGTVLSDMPESVRRLDPVEFVWLGGDPGAEMPQAPLVTLERQDPDSLEWGAVELPKRLPYSNREYRFLTRTRQGEQGWEWIARWEEMKDFPVGTYRLHVEGHYQEEGGAGGRRPYETFSRAFQLDPIDDLLITVEGSPTGITGTLAYPAALAMGFLEPFSDPGAVSGHFRMQNYWTPTGMPHAVMEGEDIVADGVVITVSDGDETLIFDGASIGVVTTFESVGGHSNVPVTRFVLEFPDPFPSGDGLSITVEATDAWGNTGSFAGPLVTP